MKSYRTTKVAWSKSQTKIVGMLMKRKIFETRFTNLTDKFVLEFKATDKDKPIAIRIIVPLKIQSSEKKQQQELQ